MEQTKKKILFSSAGIQRAASIDTKNGDHYCVTNHRQALVTIA